MYFKHTFQINIIKLSECLMYRNIDVNTMYIVYTLYLPLHDHSIY